ncbi:MAG: DUF1080 domain-containing protein [Verrucomicrobium sp.]|nr:DUF1080 domain-containing protein [Verrucomicrobium sp.]
MFSTPVSSSSSSTFVSRLTVALGLGLGLGCACLSQAAEPVKVFNGKDLSGWDTKQGKGTSKWTVGEPSVDPADPKLLRAGGSGLGSGNSFALVNLAAKHGDSLDIYSKQKFGNCRIELEVMVPKNSNSGIYVMGEYEVQVFDSFGKDKMQPSDMGAIYGAAVPSVNASKAPGEWQKYVIEWQAPKFDAAGKKTANGKFLKVELNGQVLHKDLEMPGPTPAGVTGKEAAEGPIMFQGDHGPVAYRNIVITPM